jgi:hypothetical protein
VVLETKDLETKSIRELEFGFDFAQQEHKRREGFEYVVCARLRKVESPKDGDLGT